MANSAASRRPGLSATDSKAAGVNRSGFALSPIRAVKRHRAACRNLEEDLGEVGAMSAATNDLLYFCPTSKTIHEMVRHRVHPPSEPVGEACQQDLPVADDNDWLTYRQMLPRQRFNLDGLLALAQNRVDDVLDVALI